MIVALIKTRRKELGIRQTALSEATGISQGNISKIENGVIPRFDDALKILKALKIKVTFYEEKIKK